MHPAITTTIIPGGKEPGGLGGEGSSASSTSSAWGCPAEAVKHIISEGREAGWGIVLVVSQSSVQLLGAPNIPR